MLPITEVAVMIIDYKSMTQHLSNQIIFYFRKNWQLSLRYCRIFQHMECMHQERFQSLSISSVFPLYCVEPQPLLSHSALGAFCASPKSKEISHVLRKCCCPDYVLAYDHYSNVKYTIKNVTIVDGDE